MKRNRTPRTRTRTRTLAPGELGRVGGGFGGEDLGPAAILEPEPVRSVTRNRAWGGDWEGSMEGDTDL